MMSTPEFDAEGYSMLVRPDPVLYTPRPKKRGKSSISKEVNKMKKKYLGPLVAIMATVFALDVNAAVPTAVTDAITTGGADAASVGVAVFVALIGVYAVKMMRKGL